jgi:hypothetical protein
MGRADIRGAVAQARVDGARRAGVAAVMGVGIHKFENRVLPRAAPPILGFIDMLARSIAGSKGFAVACAMFACATLAWRVPVAHAQLGEGVPSEAAAAPTPTRVIGAGTALGAGVRSTPAYFAISPGEGENLQLGLPTFELLAFVDDHFSVDVSVPLLAALLFVSPADGVFWATNVFLDWSFGANELRFVVGPGLGFEFATGQPHAGGGARLTGLIGFEVLTSDRLFGFRLVARPWFGVGGGDAGLVTHGGALLEAVVLLFDT